MADGVKNPTQQQQAQQQQPQQQQQQPQQQQPPHMLALQRYNFLKQYVTAPDEYIGVRAWEKFCVVDLSELRGIHEAIAIHKRKFYANLARQAAEKEKAKSAIFVKPATPKPAKASKKIVKIPAKRKITPVCLTPDKTFECSECGATFKKVIHLVWHDKAKHAEGSPRPQCDRCLKLFRKDELLAKHKLFGPCVPVEIVCTAKRV